MKLQVKLVAEGFASTDQATQVESYFAANAWPGTERAVHQAVESIRVKAAWHSRDDEAIKSYFMQSIA